MPSAIKIGFIGFGTVSTGAVSILLSQADLLKRRLGCALEIVRIADRDLKRDRGLALSGIPLVDNVGAILEDPSIDIVVELIGGTDAARHFTLAALNRGKHVVTANKALIAAHGEEIFDAARKQGLEVGFEASVCGGIPILQALKEGLSAEKIESVYGIVNGTCNYILTKMRDEKRDFSDVLKEAQVLGFAEADPSLDISGGDSSHKLAILANLAFGTPVDLKNIHTEGIENITQIDIAFAEQFGYQIKLLAIAKAVGEEIEARVHPTMLSKDTLLSKVEGVFNAVHVVGASLGEALFYGQGAGSLPTGSAVVSDLICIARNIRSQSSGRVPAVSFVPEARRRLRIRPMAEVESLYYLRFMVEDTHGVLSDIAGILGQHHISISSVIQQGRKIGGHVPLVMMSHRAKEHNLRAALSRIDRLVCISGPSRFIRVEGEDPS